VTPYPMDPVDATGPMRLVLCAFPSREVALERVRRAVRGKLAACANFWPIDSIYWWKRSITEDREVLVVFKTLPKRVGALFEFLKSTHPYAVPEILELDIPRVDLGYLGYLAATLDPASPPLPLGGGRPTRRAARKVRGARSLGRTQGPRHRRSKRTGTRR
jgi:periplasmic divalent cation tolerance protein